MVGSKGGQVGGGGGQGVGGYSVVGVYGVGYRGDGAQVWVGRGSGDPRVDE